jgi:hypothetical protein
MKTIVTFFYFLFTFFLLSSSLNASSTKYGYGDLNLSDFTVNAFVNYIKGNHSKAPYLFAVAADGKQYQYYICSSGLNNCGGGDQHILKECDQYSKKSGGSGNCKIFARLRTIKWDNGASRNKKFKSKWSSNEIKDKLREYNLYGSQSSNNSKSKSSSITNELNTLNSLFKSGALTEEEFKKAKKKLLSK